MTDWTQPEPATHGVPDLDLGALERAARAATAGPWVFGSGGAVRGIYVVSEPHRRDPDWGILLHIDEDPSRIPQQDVNDFAYFAAANPATMLRLIAELRAARDAAADAVEDR